jgi:hypothetical protein
VSNFITNYDPLDPEPLVYDRSLIFRIFFFCLQWDVLQGQNSMWISARGMCQGDVPRGCASWRASPEGCLVNIIPPHTRFFLVLPWGSREKKPVLGNLDWKINHWQVSGVLWKSMVLQRAGRSLSGDLGGRIWPAIPSAQGHQSESVLTLGLSPKCDSWRMSLIGWAGSPFGPRKADTLIDGPTKTKTNEIYYG